ncbi:MAG TPA: phage head closure protein [Terriglobales bacterium]|nr:phage head closure protein [Terriglobales bacterium]
MPATYPPRWFPYKVVIEMLDGTQGPTGEQNQNWVPFTTAWVSIEQLMGQERVVAQQLYATASCRLWMKFQPGIMPAMRVNYTNGGMQRLFDIHAAIDSDGRRRFLQLMCTERTEAGN